MGTPNPERSAPESPNSDEGEVKGPDPELMRDLAKRILGSSDSNSAAPTQNTPSESE